MQVLCLYGPEEIQAKCELCKQQYTVTLFDCNNLVQGIVLWEMQKFVRCCTVFALFYFKIEGSFQVQAPGGLYLEGQFNGGFLRYDYGGLYLKWQFNGGF